MKHLLVLALLSLKPYVAQAVAVDSFKCKLEVNAYSFKTRSEHDFSFQIARLPMSSSPSPDVRLTGGGTHLDHQLETPTLSISTSMTLNYMHAMKHDQAGALVEARQATCMAIASAVCPKRQGFACTPVAIACAGPNEPFDPIYGWNSVSIFGGLPAFQEKDLTPVISPIVDKNGQTIGMSYLECKFQGTYQ